MIFPYFIILPIFAHTLTAAWHIRSKNSFSTGLFITSLTSSLILALFLLFLLQLLANWRAKKSISVSRMLITESCELNLASSSQFLLDWCSSVWVIGLQVELNLESYSSWKTSVNKVDFRCCFSDNIKKSSKVHYRSIKQ